MQAKKWLILHNQQLTTNPSLPPRPVEIIVRSVENPHSPSNNGGKTGNGSKN